VALDLDVHHAGWTRWEVAGERTGVFTARRSDSLTGSIALLTVNPRTDFVHGLPDLMTVPLAVVVTTGQSSPALPPTRGGLGGVAGPGGGLVTSRTGHTDGL